MHGALAPATGPARLDRAAGRCLTVRADGQAAQGGATLLRADGLG